MEDEVITSVTVGPFGRNTGRVNVEVHNPGDEGLDPTKGRVEVRILKDGVYVSGIVGIQKGVEKDE